MRIENNGFNVSTGSSQEDLKEKKRNEYGLLSVLRVGSPILYERKGKVSKEFLETEEVKEAAKEGILVCAKMRRLEDMSNIKNLLNISEDEDKEFFGSEDFKQAAQEGFLNIVKRGDPEEMYNAQGALLISSGFILSSEELKEALKTGISKQLENGNCDNISEILANFRVPVGDLKMPRFQKVAEEAINKHRENLSLNDIEYIRETFGLPKETSQETPVQGNDADEAKNEKKTDDIREKIREQIMEDLLEEGGFSMNMALEDIVAKGQKDTGTRETINERIVKTDLPNAVNQIADGIMTDVEKRALSLDRFMEKKNLYEVVDIRPIIEREYKKVKVPGKKGFLGIGKTEDSEEYVYDSSGHLEFTEHELMHNEIVDNGKKEPAIRIIYYARKSGWKTNGTGGGRTGQSMRIEFIIPKSMLAEIKKELDNNPSFIREMSGRVMKEKILEKKEAWDGSGKSVVKLRPPYEKWDKSEGGGRMYIQQEGDPKGWNESSVKRINPTI
ncbi:MAG: hypothetical protein WC178_03775 [Candidatus Paceibacterota bacterium]